MNVERTRKYADVHIPGSSRSKTDFSSTPVSAGNERLSRLPGSLTPELPESPEGALFFAQILKLHIAYMRIYGV